MAFESSREPIVGQDVYVPPQAPDDGGGLYGRSDGWEGGLAEIVAFFEAKNNTGNFYVKVRELPGVELQWNYLRSQQANLAETYESQRAKLVRGTN